MRVLPCGSNDPNERARGGCPWRQTRKNGEKFGKAAEKSLIVSNSMSNFKARIFKIRF